MRATSCRRLLRALVLAFESAFEELVDLLVGFFGGIVHRAVGHADAIWRAEKVVDFADAVEGLPAFGRVFAAGGDEEWARGHESHDFVEIVAGGEEVAIWAGAGILCGGDAGFAIELRIFAEIPGLPVVDVGA